MKAGKKSEAAVMAKLDRITQRFTEFKSFKELCEAPNYTPTLRTDPVICRTEQDLEDMRLLRVVYKEATGKTPAN